MSSGKGMLVAACLLAGGCSAEQRVFSSEQPYSLPRGPHDPRISLIETNAYQVSQGGRYFTWYGCGNCHGNTGTHWPRSSFQRVFARIGHRGFDRRIPVEQRWQIAAYVRTLQAIDPVRRRRQDTDQKGEPTYSRWTGPL